MPHCEARYTLPSVLPGACGAAPMLAPMIWGREAPAHAHAQHHEWERCTSNQGHGGLGEYLVSTYKEERRDYARSDRYRHCTSGSSACPFDTCSQAPPAPSTNPSAAQPAGQAAGPPGMRTCGHHLQPPATSPHQPLPYSHHLDQASPPPRATTHPSLHAHTHHPLHAHAHTAQLGPPQRPPQRRPRPRCCWDPT